MEKREVYACPPKLNRKLQLLLWTLPNIIIAMICICFIGIICAQEFGLTIGVVWLLLTATVDNNSVAVLLYKRIKYWATPRVYKQKE